MERHEYMERCEQILQGLQNLVEISERRLERMLDYVHEKNCREEERKQVREILRNAPFADPEYRERQYLLEQERIRSRKRRRDGRDRHVDAVIELVDQMKDMASTEPFVFCRNLNILDLETLQLDTNTFLQLETGDKLKKWQQFAEAEQSILETVRCARVVAAENDRPKTYRSYAQRMSKLSCSQNFVADFRRIQQRKSRSTFF